MLPAEAVPNHPNPQADGWLQDIVAREITPKDGQIIATLDARRDEVYFAIYTPDYQLIHAASPHVITP